MDHFWRWVEYQLLYNVGGKANQTKMITGQNSTWNPVLLCNFKISNWNPHVQMNMSPSVSTLRWAEKQPRVSLLMVNQFCPPKWWPKHQSRRIYFQIKCQDGVTTWSRSSSKDKRNVSPLLITFLCPIYVRVKNKNMAESQEICLSPDTALWAQ